MSEARTPPKGGAPLVKPRWEAFAQLHAAGSCATSAHAAAGFSRNSTEASKLSRRKAVADRVAYLRRQAMALRPASLPEIVVALLDVAESADCSTPSGLREARLARIDARRLYVMLLRERMGEGWARPSP